MLPSGQHLAHKGRMHPSPLRKRRPRPVLLDMANQDQAGFRFSQHHRDFTSAIAASTAFA